MFLPESSNIPKLIVSHPPLLSCDVFKDTFVDLVYFGDYRANHHPTYEVTHQNFEKSQFNEEKVAATHVENGVV